MNTLERQLFDWVNWDGDQELMSFYPVVTKVQIGEFPAGTKFDSAHIDFVNSVLQLHNKDEVAEYKLVLTVGDKMG